METLSMENLILLLERAGVRVPQHEIERLRPLFKPYMDRLMEGLKVLHAADLEEEEVAGVFSPEWNLESEVIR